MKTTLMKAPAGCAMLLLVVVLAGCGDKRSEEATPQATAGQDEPAPAPPSPPEKPAPPPPDTGGTAERTSPERSVPVKPEVLPPAVKKEPAGKPAPREESKPAPTPEPKAAPAREPAAPTPAPQKPAAATPGKAAAPAVVVMRGAPLGAVRFEHRQHAERAGTTCETCHHPSRPEKPAAAPHQACSDCHTKAATAPMKTRYQAAFHNPTAQSGTCVDCHKAENAKGKKAPVKCAECHKKENK